jgi:hypothetical protein
MGALNRRAQMQPDPCGRHDVKILNRLLQRQLMSYDHPLQEKEPAT